MFRVLTGTGPGAGVQSFADFNDIHWTSRLVCKGVYLWIDNNGIAIAAGVSALASWSLAPAVLPLPIFSVNETELAVWNDPTKGAAWACERTIPRLNQTHASFAVSLLGIDANATWEVSFDFIVQPFPDSTVEAR